MRLEPWITNISILSNSYAVVEAAYQIEHLAQQPAIFLPKGPMNFNKPLLAYVRRGKILKVTSTLRPFLYPRWVPHAVPYFNWQSYHKWHKGSRHGPRSGIGRKWNSPALTTSYIIRRIRNISYPISIARAFKIYIMRYMEQTLVHLRFKYPGS